MKVDCLPICDLNVSNFHNSFSSFVKTILNESFICILILSERAKTGVKDVKEDGASRPDSAQSKKSESKFAKMNSFSMLENYSYLLCKTMME